MLRPIAVACALTVGATAPSAAQDVSTSTALLTHFATRCGQIAADPTTAVSGIAGASARIAGDRSLITHSEPVGENGTIAFRQMQFETGKSSDCALTITGYGAAQYDDLGVLIAENGAALFGTGVTVYGNNAAGNTVQMIATPGYPPAASLTQVQTRDRLELVLSLHSAPQAADPTPQIVTEADTDQSTPGKQAEVEEAPQQTAQIAPAPQPQVLEILPTPQPAPAAPEVVVQAPLSAEDLAIGDDMLMGIITCLNAASDPMALPTALLEAGFAFTYVGGGGELNFRKGGASVQLSALPRDGICTALGASQPYALAQHVGEKAVTAMAVAGSPPPVPSLENGCPATTFTGPTGPVTLTYINPTFRKICDDATGAAVRISLQ